MGVVMGVGLCVFDEGKSRETQGCVAMSEARL